MARVAILFLFSLALLALLGTASPLTCSEEPAFLRFTAGSSRFDLIDDSNKRFGVLNMTVSEGEVANFFKMEFSVFPHIGLLKIRAGLFASGGSFVMGKQRYTRRRKLSKLDDESTWISEASIIMKPEDIMVITPGVSCCGAQLDFYAFAQVRVLGEEGPEEVRVYLAPSSTGTSCRVPNPKKPFRQVCSIETLCLTCSSSNCEPNQEGYASHGEGCGCRDIQCSGFQCIDSHVCQELSVFQETQCSDNMLAIAGPDGICECNTCPSSNCRPNQVCPQPPSCLRSGGPLNLCLTLRSVPESQTAVCPRAYQEGYGIPGVGCGCRAIRCSSSGSQCIEAQACVELSIYGERCTASYKPARDRDGLCWCRAFT